MEAAETAEVEEAIKAADMTEASLGVARAVQEADLEELMEASGFGPLLPGPDDGAGAVPQAPLGTALREKLAAFLGSQAEAIGCSRGEVHARFAAAASPAEVDRLLSELAAFLGSQAEAIGCSR